MLEDAKRGHKPQESLEEQLLDEFLDGIPEDVLVPMKWPRMSLDERLHWAAGVYCQYNPDYVKDLLTKMSNERVKARLKRGSWGI